MRVPRRRQSQVSARYVARGIGLPTGPERQTATVRESGVGPAATAMRRGIEFIVVRVKRTPPAESPDAAPSAPGAPRLKPPYTAHVSYNVGSVHTQARSALRNRRRLESRLHPVHMPTGRDFVSHNPPLFTNNAHTRLCAHRTSEFWPRLSTPLKSCCMVLSGQFSPQLPIA
jgi:hypothetical protein